MIAVISSGSKQYIVEKGQQIAVELLTNKDKVEFKPLLVIDGDKVHIGKPLLENANVSANVIEQTKKSEKVTVLKYKAKKRQKKIHGHRQVHTVLEIKSISI